MEKIWKSTEDKKGRNMCMCEIFLRVTEEFKGIKKYKDINELEKDAERMQISGKWK